MKKVNLVLATFLLLGGLAFSQATLPTSYQFDGTLPTGWTSVLDIWAGNTTYGSGQGDNVSCRLDATGEYVEIFFDQAPGAVTYYIKGTAINPPAFNGEFTIQESVNGSDWTAMRTLTSPDLTNDFVLFTDQPASVSRYVRFFYTTKESGSNIALDLIGIALPTETPEQEINITENSVTVSNNSTFVTGTSTSTLFTIENLGTTDVLTISGSTITGENTSDFSINDMPTTVAATGSETFTLNFTPSGDDGSKFATITINSNDVDESAYIINIYAIKGNYATEPTEQSSAIHETTLTSYTMDIEIIPASETPESYIVLRKTGAEITEIPTDGSTYTVGDYIGDAQVAYIGDAATFTPKNIIANTNYYFSVFAFNGLDGFENYLTTAPAAMNRTSLDGNAGTYYNTLTPGSATFIADLKSLIGNHSQIYYSNYQSTVLNEYETRDTTGGQLAITCIYSSYNFVYTEPFGWANSAIGGELSREHTFCASWMASQLGTSSDDIEYSDLYNLFPAEFNHANLTRSNYPLGEVVNVTSNFNDGTFGTDADGNKVYEPRDEHKGDAARAMFYMCAAYGFVLPAVIDGFSVPYGQDQAILKQWNTQDPVSNWEIGRNDYINSKQGNRNVFIDHPEWINDIDFSDMTLTSIEKVNSDLNTTIFPNPSLDGKINITSQKNINAIEVFDILGQSIYMENNINANIKTLSIDKQGVYFVKVTFDNTTITKRITIE